MIGTVFLASLCFSLVVEALQTLFHIGHSDEMHHPIPVLCVGAAGVLLNGLCYLLIGGYTFHQGSFLHVTSSGDVVLERAVSQDRVSNGPVAALPPSEAPSGALSPAAVATSYLQAGVSGTPPLRQGPREMFRDVVGCFLVIICSLVVYFTDANVAKYVDPIISIVSAVLLLALSYPYMKESGLILLQTIPDHINIESLRSHLCDAFAPAVVGVHDLHIWQLTPQRTYATAHIVFVNSKDISSVMKEVTEFFHEQGISHVTIQPEFLRCRAISIPNANCGNTKPHGLMVTNRSKAGQSSYAITMERTMSAEGVICFLQCAGRGGSCRNLHCCDEAKGEPLALPHHHHVTTHRHHSLDEVAEHGSCEGPSVTHPPLSTSSPSLVARQKIPSENEAVTCRRAVSDNALEKSTVKMLEGQASGKGAVMIEGGVVALSTPHSPHHTGMQRPGDGGGEETTGEPRGEDGETGDGPECSFKEAKPLSTEEGPD